MKKTKKFKIIACLLIFTVVALIFSPASFKENVKNFIRVNVLSNLLSDKSNKQTELGELQGLIALNKGKADEAIKSNDLESCKEIFNEISRKIDEKKDGIDKEFNKAEEIANSSDSQKAKEGLKEVRTSYGKLLESIDKIQEVVENNSIEGYSKLLADENIFGKGEERVTTLGDKLPHNNSIAEVRSVDVAQATEKVLTSYPMTASEASESQYLKETIDTKQNDKIVKKAKEIGNNPIDIYEYVRNNTNYQPYSGSRKGAIGALQEYAGNDYDQSSLLIALFRANNIPARYVSGEIELTPEKAMAWTGTNTVEAAARTLGAAGNPTTSIVSGGKIIAVRVEHVWVEAYCPMGEYRGSGEDKGEKQWVPFDPSFKEYKKIEGLNLQEKGEVSKEDIEDLYIYSENTSDGLGVKRTDVSEFKDLFDNIKSNTNSNLKESDISGKRAIDITGGLDIIKEDMEILPFSIPNKLVKINKRMVEIDDSKRDYISFGLVDNIGLFGELSFRKSAVELYGKKLTLSWEAASEGDRKIIKEYGGDIFKVPAYLIEVKPVIKVDGQTVVTGSPIQFGEDENLSITLERVGFSKDKFSNVLIAGGYYALGLDYGAISPDELQDIQKRMEIAKDKIDKVGYYSDEVIGEIVNGTVKSYFSEVDGMNTVLSQSYNIKDTRLLSFGISGVSPKVSTIINKPVDVKLNSLYVDIDNDVHAVVNNENNREKEKDYTMQSGMIGSTLEHTIVEQVTGIKGVSTIKVIEEASKKGIGIYNIDKSNIDKILPKLKVNNTIKEDIKNAVNANNEVLIPEENITLYDWKGTGYIVSDPNTGSAGYMITGGLAGGSTTSDLSEVDFGKIALEFLKGFCVGIGTGIAFSCISIGIMIIAPEIIPYYMALVSLICTITFGYDIITHIKSLYDGEMNTQEWYCYCAYMTGMMIGAVIAGTFTSEFLLKQINVKIKATNEKYGISEKLSDKIRENTAIKDYSKVAEQASKLKELGFKENEILDILDGVPSNKLGEFYNAINRLKNKNPEETISQRSIEAVKKGVQEGKTGDELIKLGELATNPEKLINSGEKFQDNSLEWRIVRDYLADKVKEIRLENKGTNNLGGNVSYSDISINGNNYNIKGTSKPKNIEGFAELRGEPNAKTDPQRFFETKFVDGKGNVYEQHKPNVNWNRAVDTEARTLEQICRDLGSYKNEKGEIIWGNTDAKGIINLFTENEPCPSCLDVINQFSNVYKNIEINIYWIR